MTEKFGVNNVKKFVDLLICIGGFAGASIVGKRWIFSIGATWTFVSTMKNIFFGDTKMDFTQLWPEVKDLSQEESKELVNYIKVKLSLPDNQKEVERTVETIVDQAGKLYLTIASIVSFWSNKIHREQGEVK